MTRRADDPYANFNFLVEIDGVSVAGFSEASGISSETDVIEYRVGSEKTLSVRKLPGLTKTGNVTLKRGITKNSELWDWRKTVIEGQTERRTVSITLQDEARDPVVRFFLREAWPVKYEGPGLKAQSDEIAIETLEIAAESIDVEFD